MLLCAYDLLLQSGIVKPCISVTQQQAHYALVKSWVGQKSMPEIVIAGTSRAATLLPEEISAQAGKLAFNGQSSATALAVLAAGKVKPKLVITEIGGETLSLMAPVDSGIVQAAELNSSGMPLMPTAHDFEYQPLNILLANILPNKIAINGRYRGELEKKARHWQFDAVEKSLSRKQLNTMTEHALEIKHLIAALEKDGCRVLLVEIPMDKEAETSPRVSEAKALTNKLFPDSEFHWIKRAAGNWPTGDIFHLNDEGKVLYSRWLRQELIKQGYLSGNS